MWKADKTVKVTTQFGIGDFENAEFTDGADVLGVVTVSVPVYDTETGKWEDHPTDTRAIFGRCTPDGYLTHMCYGSDYVNWPDFVSLAREHGWHYFDAGSNGRPVRISAVELELAMTDLGLFAEGGPEQKATIYSTSGYVNSDGTRNPYAEQPQKPERLTSEVEHRDGIVTVQVTMQGGTSDRPYIRVYAISQGRADEFWHHVASAILDADLWAARIGGLKVRIDDNE